MISRFEEAERNLGHVFHDKRLLETALTHASIGAAISNERLEFLGDRVLGLVIAERLHHIYPEDPEGALALKLNALVRKEACVNAAVAAGLPEHLVLASSEASSGGRQKAVILAGACEAVIAALYLDGGIDAARRFIDRFWTEAFSALRHDMRDAKTSLQEWAQGHGAKTGPGYRVVKREGPDHDPRFVVEVTAAGEARAQGSGRSKREAEQAAAKALLSRLGLWKQ